MTAPVVPFIEKNPCGMTVFTLDDPTIQERFVIGVSVPASCEMRPDARYPVLHALDGDASMGLATTAPDDINLGSDLVLGRNVPDMIVVDNSPGVVVPASGGAEAFCAFLTKTLLPTRQANLRVDPSLAGIEQRFAASSRSLPARLFPSACSVEPTPTHRARCASITSSSRPDTATASNAGMRRPPRRTTSPWCRRPSPTGSTRSSPETGRAASRNPST